MPTEPLPPTVSQIVNAAADAVDPTGADPDVAAFFQRFEDRDEPASSVVDDLEDQFAAAQRAIDVDGGSEALQQVVAVATYLGFRRDQVGSPPEDLVRRALSAEEASRGAGG